MSTVRIQVRRGTAAQWTAANPVLEAGEMGFESDTKYLKFGDGTTTWTSLAYANDPGIANLTSTLTGYVEITDIGAVSGVAGLDASKNLIVPGASIIVEGATDNGFETTLTVVDPTADRTITFPNATGTVALTSDISALVDSAPGTLDTLNELAAALGDDANFAVTVTNALNALSNGKQAVVTNVSDTEIGYLDGVTSAIQTQIDAKLATATAASTYAPIADPTFTGTVSLPSFISFEGTTADAHETLITVTEPTADRTITFPNATGTVALTSDISTHTDDTTNVHGIADTSVLATTTAVNTAASNAESNAITAAGIAAASAIATAVTNHENDTTNVHGIADTSALALTATVNTALDLKAPLAGPTFTGTVTVPTLAITTTATGITKTMVGLSNVDNTADASKPISTATQTALDLKAPLAGPTFTGTLAAADITVSGNLTVNGTTTNLNSTNLVIEDKNIVLGDTATPTDTTADGGGLTLKGATDKTFNWVDATDSWTSSEHINLASGKDLKVNGTAVISSTAGGFIFTDGTQTKEGVPSRTTIIQKTAAYTLSDLSERDDLIEVSHTGGSAVDITVPTDATLNFPIGTSIDILRTNTGGVRIVAAAGATVNSTPGAFLRAQWSSATLFKRAANTWVLIGDLATA